MENINEWGKETKREFQCKTKVGIGDEERIGKMPKLMSEEKG